MNKQLIYEVLAATVKTQALAIGSRGSVGESILRPVTCGHTGPVCMSCARVCCNLNFAAHARRSLASWQALWRKRSGFDGAKHTFFGGRPAPTNVIRFDKILYMILGKRQFLVC